MKLSVVLLFVSFLQATASLYSQETRFSFRAENQQVVAVLRQIEENSKFRFFFLREQVDIERRVNVTASDATLEEVLEQLFRDQNVKYEFANEELIVLTTDNNTRVVGTAAFQQAKSVSGRVTDSQGAPLPGVSVVVKGSTNGTITDVNGNYAISDVPENGTLVFSFIGMKTQEVAVAGQSQVNLAMVDESLGLDEVVVIGYGTVRKRDLTGSVKTVSSEDLSKNPVSQIGQALSGKVSGVVVQQSSGVPGSSPTIRIRGGNSINGDNSPLFVVDGFISSIGAQEINSEDIKSIEVLKDASATAIYGSRGANGVILITTKGGKSGEKIQMNFKSYLGLQEIIKRMDMMDATQHARYLNDYAVYRGLAPFIENPDQLPYNTDWQDEMLQTALQQSHYLSMSGGSEKVAFNSSVEYFDQDGIVRNSGYERFNIRSKLDFNLNKYIRSGLQLSFRRSRTDQVNGVFKDVLGMSPTFPVYKDDGTYNYILSYDNPGMEVNNPIEELKEYTKFLQQKTFGLQAYVDVKLLGEVYFKSEVSYSWKDNKTHNFIPSTTLTGSQNMSTASLRSFQIEALETVNTMRWEKYLEDIHHFNLVGGVSTIAEDAAAFSAQTKDLASDVLKYFDLSAGDPLQNSVSSDYSMVKQLSFLGRANYGLKEKYLFTISGRYDGSSNFGENNRFAFFPSGAFAWRLSQEEFIKRLGWFDNLKMRLTYGITGSQAISPYQTLALLKARKLPLGGQRTLGFLPGNIANPELKWESTKQFDAGVDFGFMNNKLQFTVDYYYKKTQDLLLDKAIPGTTGFDSMIDNVGSVENKGVEFDAKAVLLDRKNVGWNLDINFSRNRSEILDLGDTDFIFPNDSKVENAKTDRTNILQTGKPVGSFYTYVYDGLFQTEEEINAYPHISNTRPGGVKIRDVNEDGVITEGDKMITGHAEPDFTFGISNEVNLFNKVSIFMFWQGAVGGEILNYDRYLFSLNASNVPVYMNNYWTSSNMNTSIPAPGYSGLVTDNYIEDGSYIRLKNITISYSLPKSLLSKVNIQSASLFFTGYDILTFTDYTGINPEVNFFGDSNAIQSADFNSYPTTRSFTLGVNLKF